MFVKQKQKRDFGINQYIRWSSK